MHLLEYSPTPEPYVALVPLLKLSHKGRVVFARQVYMYPEYSNYLPHVLTQHDTAAIMSGVSDQVHAVLEYCTPLPSLVFAGGFVSKRVMIGSSPRLRLCAPPSALPDLDVFALTRSALIEFVDWYRTMYPDTYATYTRSVITLHPIIGSPTDQTMHVVQCILTDYPSPWHILSHFDNAHSRCAVVSGTVYSTPDADVAHQLRTTWFSLPIKVARKDKAECEGYRVILPVDDDDNVELDTPIYPNVDITYTHTYRDPQYGWMDHRSFRAPPYAGAEPYCPLHMLPRKCHPPSITVSSVHDLSPLRDELGYYHPHGERKLVPCFAQYTPHIHRVLRVASGVVFTYDRQGMARLPIVKGTFIAAHSKSTEWKVSAGSDMLYVLLVNALHHLFPDNQVSFHVLRLYYGTSTTTCSVHEYAQLVIPIKNTATGSYHIRLMVLHDVEPSGTALTLEPGSVYALGLSIVNHVPYIGIYSQ